MSGPNIEAGSLPEFMAHLQGCARKATGGRHRWAVTEKATREELIADHAENLSHSDSNAVHSVGAMDHPGTVLGDEPERPQHLVITALTGNGPNSENNAKFYAAANPVAVLVLLAHLQQFIDCAYALQMTAEEASEITGTVDAETILKSLQDAWKTPQIDTTDDGGAS